MYRKTTLHNKLTVVTHRMPEHFSVSLGIWIKAGARYEQARISGISHFLEHLLFKGTARRSCEEIKQSIEGIGGSLNGFTAEELTCYLAKLPGKYLSSALDVLGDMVLNARLEHKDIEMERKVILEEIRTYKDLPGHFVAELLTKLLWPDQPLGTNIAGESESVRAIKRNELLAYKRRFYQLDNIVVVACGNLRHQQVVEDCRRYMRSPQALKKRKQFTPVREQQKSPRVKFQFKDIEQTHLALGVHSVARNHPGRYILGLLHVVLGANMSSRLFREVREERGLAYEVGTALRFFQDTGAFVVRAGIDNRRVVEALEVILQQLREVKKRKIGADELNRAKEYYTGQLMLALEDTSDHMLWLGENFVSLNRFVRTREVIRAVERVTADDVQEIANKIFQNRNLNLALIGPLKNKDTKRIQQGLGL